MKRAQGYSRGNEDLRRIVVSFDSETFEAIRSRADLAHTSFAEEVRLLTTIGIETMEAA